MIATVPNFFIYFLLLVGGTNRCPIAVEGEALLFCHDLVFFMISYVSLYPANRP